jgi:hypothetical protein
MALKKLRAALAKIAKRLSGREDEERIARSKSHRLSREIQHLREDLDEANKHHAATLKLLTKAEGTPEAEKLGALADSQARVIHDLVLKIQRKVGKRSSWRKRRRKAQKRVAWWLRRRTTVRKQFKAAKEKWDKEHRLDFEPWMLNGCPNIDNDKLKQVIAYVVVACDQYITATTNGTHAPGSFHYIDEAVDWGAGSVSSMQTAAVKTRGHFGREHFLEFFSPCNWWIKYGVEYPGYFPGHGDHGHTAVSK